MADNASGDKTAASFTSSYAASLTLNILVNTVCSRSSIIVIYPHKMHGPGLQLHVWPITVMVLAASENHNVEL